MIRPSTAIKIPNPILMLSSKGSVACATGKADEEWFESGVGGTCTAAVSVLFGKLYGSVSFVVLAIALETRMILRAMLLDIQCLLLAIEAHSGLPYLWKCM